MGKLNQRALIHIAKHRHVDHTSTTTRSQRDHRRFDLVGKHADALHSSRYFLERAVAIEAGHDLDRNGGASLRGRRFYATREFQTANLSLNGQQNRLLDLIRAGPPIPHFDLNRIEFVQRIDLLADILADDQSHYHHSHHQQIRRNMIAGKPG